MSTTSDSFQFVLTGDVIATTMRRVGSGENATYDTSAVKRFKALLHQRLRLDAV